MEPTMIRQILILLLTLLTIPAFAQEGLSPYPNTASRKEDSIFIAGLLNNAGRLQATDPDSAIKVAYAAFQKSMVSVYKEDAGRALALIGVGYRNLGHYRKSIIYLQKAIPFIKKQHFHSDYFVAAAYNVMFGSFFPLGQYDSAAINCYYVIDLYNHSNAADINPKGAIVNPLIDAYQYLGLVWYKLGFGSKALEYLQRAADLSAKDPNHYEMMQIMINKASVLLSMDKPDSAIVFNEKARKMAVQVQDSAMLELIGLNASIAQLKKETTEEHAADLERLIGQGMRVVETEIEATYILAEAYLNLKKYDRALRTIAPAEEKAKSLNLNYSITQPYFLRSRIYAEQGRTDKAYEELKIANQLSDSFLSIDKIQVLNILDVALHTSEKDKQLSANKLQISNQRVKLRERGTWLWAAVTCSTLLLVLLAALYRTYKHKRGLQEERISSLNKEREIAQLKAVMKGEEQERTRLARELHDGFISQLSAIKMNFSALKGHANEEKYEENMQQLEETIQDLRKTAHNLMPEILLHGNLGEAIEAYCERMASAHHVAIDFEVYGFLPRLQTEFELTLYRMIQEALQNVVKHAGATHALVQVNSFNDVVSITIEDNGNGIELDKQQKKDSSGMENLKARVNALNGYINISGKPHIGTTIYVEFETSDKVIS